VVVEVGGGLRSYSAGGRELVDGYGADEMSSSGRGQALIPWPNRLQDGSYEFDGRRHQLPLNEPEHRNAIHGLVRWAAWTASEREPHRAVMEHVLYPQPGYPFSLTLSIEYAPSDSGLRVRTTARNVGTDPCPYGSGAHPYLTLGTATVDRLMLRVPGRTVLRSDERGLPIGTEAVQNTEYDFRQPRRIGSTRRHVRSRWKLTYRRLSSIVRHRTHSGFRYAWACAKGSGSSSFTCAGVVRVISAVGGWAYSSAGRMLTGRSCLVHKLDAIELKPASPSPIEPAQT